MRAILITLVAAALLAQAAPTCARASDPSSLPVFPSEHSRTETLWIFDADFEDLLGDNAGWMGEDWSRTVACTNYWHKDTIRMAGYPHLGDSTWWCGKYDACWMQPRGYGNNWTCTLSRSFPELASAAQPGDVLRLQYDQRLAIESCYDYGYTDVSTDGGATWTTVRTVHNASCPTHPGISLDWDASNPHGPGHVNVDLSEYAGQSLDLRFRFESDQYYSSQDQYDNMIHSVLDGAWQLDNIAWYVNYELFWLDDCESPGHDGWVTEDAPASGQTGIAYRRSYEELGGRTGWMMTAYDTTSGIMVPGQYSVLYSPPIYVAGASELVMRWEGWVDIPGWDYARIRHMQSDSLHCLEGHLPRYPYSHWSQYEEDPGWVSEESSIYYTGSDWLGLRIEAIYRGLAGLHGMGFALDRIRVGVPLTTAVPDDEVSVNELRRVYPNPFSSAATIAYSLANAGHVTLRVHDAAGRVVRVLLDAEMDAGAREVRWDGRTDAGDRAASGVYFVKMTLPCDGSNVGTREQKLVLLK